MIEIYKDQEASYRFNLRAKSGSILLNSVDFVDKNKADEIIKMLKTMNLTRNHFERKTNHSGQFLFNLKDNDGNLIGQSQFYDSEMGMENGIKNLQNRLEELKNSTSSDFGQNF